MPLTLHFRILALFDYSKNVCFSEIDKFFWRWVTRYPDSTVSDPTVPERWLTSGFVPKPCERCSARRVQKNSYSRSRGNTEFSQRELSCKTARRPESTSPSSPSHRAGFGAFSMFYCVRKAFAEDRRLAKCPT